VTLNAQKREVTIEKLVPGGAGFARLPDGRSLFVERAFPGDRVRVLELEEKKGYARAHRFELVEAGPDRIEPACRLAATCGGCDWMALSGSAQQRNKALLVKEALERTGGARLEQTPPLVTAGAPFGYRMRVRLHVENGKVGYFARGSRELVSVPECPVAVDALAPVIRAIHELGAAHAPALRHFSAIELAAPPGSARIAIDLVPREGADVRAPAVSALVQRLKELGQIRVGTAGGASARRYEQHDGAFLSVPGGAFTQVNWAVNEALVSAVLAGALARGIRSVLELYAGVGNFTLPLLRAGHTAVAVELDAQALRALADAAQAQGLKCETIAGDVPRVLGRLAKRKGAFDLALLDPPRAGAKDAIPPLLALAPRFVAYVSCDPVTLARDVRTLGAAGFELSEVTCFDMFPQTHHVETLTWFARAAAA
jgi:23S rRNA (uracil1939-C5)-methyltransferase